MLNIFFQTHRTLEHKVKYEKNLIYLTKTKNHLGDQAIQRSECTTWKKNLQFMDTITTFWSLSYLEQKKLFQTANGINT